MTANTRLLVLDQAVGLWGAQRYLLRLAGPLHDLGIDLVLAAPSGLDLSRAWIEAGLEHVDLALPIQRSVRTDGEKGRLSVRAMASEARTMRATSRLIADAAVAHGCDVIHANGHGIHLDAVFAGRRAKLPVVLHLHEEMPQLFGRALRSTAVAIADSSVAVSQAVANGLVKPLRRKVTVIANGVDTDAIQPGPAVGGVRESLGVQPGDVVLLALTRLDPEKRIEDLIEAMSPLRDADGWHLAVAGETSSYPDYALRVRALAARELPGRVTFAGRREDVRALLNSSDVLVHAGVIEGMPLGLLEAQAAGLPVVAYRVAGVPEAVRDGETGLLAAPGDVGELGRHIAALVRDRELRHRLGVAGRAHVERAHTLAGQAEQYASLLDTLIGRIRPVNVAAA
ncbi:MAG: glycosyltransferase family 4 protein [Acidothermaceae bacterium]